MLSDNQVVIKSAVAIDCTSQPVVKQQSGFIKWSSESTRCAVHARSQKPLIWKNPAARACHALLYSEAPDLLHTCQILLPDNYLEHQPLFKGLLRGGGAPGEAKSSHLAQYSVFYYMQLADNQLITTNHLLFGAPGHWQKGWLLWIDAMDRC